jgi:hypothetical protein
MNSNDLIASSVIEQTKVYQNLGKINPNRPHLNNKIHQTLLIKRQSRELITNALNVYNNTKVIPSNIGGYQLEVLKELISESTL